MLPECNLHRRENTASAFTPLLFLLLSCNNYISNYYPLFKRRKQTCIETPKSEFRELLITKYVYIVSAGTTKMQWNCSVSHFSRSVSKRVYLTLVS
jgi:hypothetical protein